MILLACCWLSYRFIEAPMQRQGRKFAAWLEYWFGPDSIPAHVEAQDVQPFRGRGRGRCMPGPLHAGGRAAAAHAPASSGSPGRDHGQDG